MLCLTLKTVSTWLHALKKFSLCAYKKFIFVLLGYITSGMAIPLHTFEFDDSEYLRYPEPPWKLGAEIPDAWFSKHVYQFLYSPTHIAREAELYALNSGPWKSGLYFLLINDEIVYVGKSVEIMRRLNQHKNKGWSFNKYWCFGGLPELYIEHVEAFYIHAFEPPLNEKYPIPHPVIAPLIKAAQRGVFNYHA